MNIRAASKCLLKQAFQHENAKYLDWNRCLNPVNLEAISTQIGKKLVQIKCLVEITDSHKGPDGKEHNAKHEFTPTTRAIEYFATEEIYLLYASFKPTFESNSKFRPETRQLLPLNLHLVPQVSLKFQIPS